MKTTIAFITFTLIAQAPAQRYGRYDHGDTYHHDTHRQDVDRLTKAQEATTRAVEKARAQAESDAQRARTEASLDAYDAQKAADKRDERARLDAVLESAYVPRSAPAASSYVPPVTMPRVYSSYVSPTPEADFNITKADVDYLGEMMIVRLAARISEVQTATNLTADQKKREIELVIKHIRLAATK